MTETDIEYFEWLVSQIEVPRNRTLGDVFSRMHNFEFVPFIPNDDNRWQDGLDLRSQFSHGVYGHESDGGLNLEYVTLLEVLVALSKRLEFNGGGSASWWAWKLVKNLRLHRFTDPLLAGQDAQIDDILYNLVWRTYEKNGKGGFFPLKNPPDDQTKIEIWYQMNSYIHEMRDF